MSANALTSSANTNTMRCFLISTLRRLRKRFKKSSGRAAISSVLISLPSETMSLRLSIRLRGDLSARHCWQYARWPLPNTA